MSVTEAKPEAKLIFDEITRKSLQEHPQIIRATLPLIRDACKHSKGRFTYESVFDGINEGRYRLWGVLRPPASLESIAVTAVDPMPGGRVFDVLIAGPEFEAIFAALPVLESAARSLRCERMRFTGPSFWRKRLPEGWRPAASIFEKAL